MITTASVLVYAVACCSAAVAEFLANESIVGVPNETAERTAKTTKKHYASVHANYAAHRTVANIQRNLYATDILKPATCSKGPFRPQNMATRHFSEEQFVRSQILTDRIDEDTCPFGPPSPETNNQCPFKLISRAEGKSLHGKREQNACSWYT